VAWPVRVQPIASVLEMPPEEDLVTFKFSSAGDAAISA
jgi:hypothetical protein